MNKAKVLFLCTSNAARSQMAEAFLKKHGGDRYDAYSAGTDSKGINPYTEKVMKEMGISLTDQYSKHVKEYMGKAHFGYLITVCGEADKNCPTVFPGISQKIQWSFEDPAALLGTEEEKLTKFREVRDQIEQRVKEWLREQQGK